MRYILLLFVMINLNLFAVPSFIEINSAFEEIGENYDINPLILKTIAYKQSNWDIYQSEVGTFGIMGLYSKDNIASIEIGANLTNYSEFEAISDYKKNIEMSAAILKEIEYQLLLNGEIITTLEDYSKVLIQYLNIGDFNSAKNEVFDLYLKINNGYEITNEIQSITIEGMQTDLSQLIPSYSLRMFPDIDTSTIINCSYNCTNASRTAANIDYVIIHTCQGGFSGCWSWLRNPDAGASAHYVISKYGEIKQIVANADIAWHAGNWWYNERSIGIEHEGWISDPNNYTDSMYRSSAMLTKWLCDTYSVPKDRSHIIEHDEVPNQSHTDPGPYWNWNYYMSLINDGCSGVCNPGQTQTQGCGNCGHQTRTCTNTCQWGGWSGCSGEGVCSAGTSQNQGCGNCGTQSRSCNSSCQWNGWSGCTGEGCSPGTTQNNECGKCGNQVRNCNSSCQWVNVGDCVNQKECFKGETQDQDCCDCGTQRRTCSNTCYWQGWSACAGADPNGGNTDCTTNEFGPCSAGKVKCTNGCLNCKRIYEPIAELCDDVDNDCSGEVDNGEPTNFIPGITPQYAAEFKDGGYPKNLKIDENGQVWVIFKNKGLKTWYANTVWIQSVETESKFYNKDKWQAYNIPAVLEYDVMPEEDAIFVFDIKITEENIGEIKEKFQLAFNKGQLIKCPVPSIEVIINAIENDDKTNDDNEQDITENDDNNSKVNDNSACDFGNNNSITIWMLFIMMIVFIKRKINIK